MTGPGKSLQQPVQSRDLGDQRVEHGFENFPPTPYAPTEVTMSSYNTHYPIKTDSTLDRSKERKRKSERVRIYLNELLKSLHSINLTRLEYNSDPFFFAFHPAQPPFPYS